MKKLLYRLPLILSMKRISAFIFILFVFYIGKADTNLLIWSEKAPTPVAFSFSSMPKITFGTNEMTVTSTYLSVTYSTDSKIYFKFEETSDIRSTFEDTKPHVFVKQGQLEITNISSGTSVEIYTIGGEILYRSNDQRDLSIPISKGFYLVKIGKETYKIKI